MNKLDNIKEAFRQVGNTMEGMLKVALMSRGCSRGDTALNGDSLVVLGNGPSLRTTISEHPEFLAAHKKLAVNFAANAPEFFTLKPDYYVLADPHFFNGVHSNVNVKRVWENIGRTDWPMTLWVPRKNRMQAASLLYSNAHIILKHYNLTPVEGASWFRRLCYRSGAGMPRPRNVLIPAIMLGMREGFKKIYIAGADHSWLQSLWVDDENRVVSVQPHFYADNEVEKARVTAEYAGYHLHDILGSMVVAFRSYFDIKKYADSIGVEIVNITPGSYIDAFPREKI